MPTDKWAKEVATLASVVDSSGPDFTEAEKRHWLGRLMAAATEDEETSR